MNTVLPVKYSDLRTPFLQSVALALCLLLPAISAHASEVIVIKDTETKPYRDAIDGFKKTCGCDAKEMGLADLGALEQALKQRPDAVVAVGTHAFRKAKAIKNLPVVYLMVMPSETTEARNGNVSGVSMDISPGKWLSMITSLLPSVKKIGLLFDPEHTGHFVEQALAAAKAGGVSLATKTIHDPRQVPALLDELNGKVDALWMLPDATLISSEAVDYLLLFSFRNNLPLFSFSEKYVERGALAALKIDPSDIGAQTGEIVRGLLQGGKGPVRAFARNASLIVNSKVGTKIGARINDDIARDAKKVE